MIVYLAQVVNLIASLIQNFIVLTSAVGQVIVVLITNISSIIIKSIGSVLLFFQIIYEDNKNIFTEQLPNMANEMFDAIYGQSSHLQNILLSSYEELIFKLSTILSSIKWTFGAVFIVCRDVLLILKKTLIFFGDTLWLLLTFVPVHLPLILKTFIVYVKDLVVSNVIDGYMELLRVTNFLSDVPLESFMGLITAIIITRSCIHFRSTIQYQITNVYWITLRKIMYLYYSIYNYFTDPEGRIISQLVGGQPIVSRDINVLDNPDDPNGADALCVICQERQKCVLTLPCRHVCLCTECCMRLYDYQRTCPVCRTFIYHSVTVYL
ncbi:unnamed protein product [Danaus chrysippus]|uniref:(African queen) hypothetical protein n=1 Tax=Danaus chrysippus TaxID=151541 RepID=A0A8J2W4I5_9NEOP|nr:unnamed protein product [Danaus chrysippus]